MTPVFCCGFECGQALAGTSVGQHWAVGSATPVTIDTTTKRNGARSLRINAPTSNSLAYATSPNLGNNAVWVGRVAVYFTSLPAANWPIFLGRTSNAGVYFKSSDSKLYPGYGGATPTFGSDGVSVTTGQWYIVNLRIDISANPWTIDVKVDGTATTQLTRAVAATTDDSIQCGSGVSVSGVDMYFDDVVLSNTSGDYPIGDGYVNHFVPTSDGTHNVAGANDFDRGDTGTDITNATTDSYLLVDDVPLVGTTPDANDNIRCTAPPNATDYVENVFGPAPGISTPTTGPVAVEAIVATHQAGTGLGTVALKLNDNGTEDTVWALANEAGVVTTRYARKHYATMVGGGAWTAARFNALKIRFGYCSDANPDQYFDSGMIEAAFEVGAQTFAPDVATGTGQAYIPTIVASGDAPFAPDTATGTGTAYDCVIENVIAEQFFEPDVAVGTGQAYDPTIVASGDATFAPAAATGTGQSYDATIVASGDASFAPDVATGTGQAYDATIAASGDIVFAPDAAAGTGQSYDATIVVSGDAPFAPDVATGTGQAYDAGIVASGDAVFELDIATGSGQAYDATIAASGDVVFAPDTAVGTGEAYDADLASTIQFQVDIATGTGQAYDPNIVASGDVTFSPDAATGTGEAYDAEIISDEQIFAPDTATGTGQAYDVSILASGDAPFAVDTATGTGAAYNPNIVASGSATFIPDVATGTGTAYDPGLIISFAPDTATGTGQSYDPGITATGEVAFTPDTATGTGQAYNPSITNVPTPPIPPVPPVPPTPPVVIVAGPEIGVSGSSDSIRTVGVSTNREAIYAKGKSGNSDSIRETGQSGSTDNLRSKGKSSSSNFIRTVGVSSS